MTKMHVYDDTGRHVGEDGDFGSGSGAFVVKLVESMSAIRPDIAPLLATLHTIQDVDMTAVKAAAIGILKVTPVSHFLGLELLENAFKPWLDSSSSGYLRAARAVFDTSWQAVEEVSRQETAHSMRTCTPSRIAARAIWVEAAPARTLAGALRSEAATPTLSAFLNKIAELKAIFVHDPFVDVFRKVLSASSTPLGQAS